MPVVQKAPVEYQLAFSGSHPNVEVAGEAFREAEITRAIGRSPGVDEEIEVTVTAHLVPEPDNPHDKNAISVRINGEVVGYIERDQTRQYKNAVHRIAASGCVASTTARVWVVRRLHNQDGTRFYSRITVALPAEGIALPENDPPTTAYSILPWGSAVQVSGEEEHFDVLKRYVPKSGIGLVLLTLHRAEKLLKSGASRELAEVRVDGRRIGELSPATSKHFLPIIDHVDSGLSVAAWGRIKGSALTAEVTVQGAKASELSDEWLRGEAVTVPQLVPVATSYAVPSAYVAQPVAVKAAKRTLTGVGGQQAAKKSGCLVVAIAIASLASVIGVGISNLV